MNNTDFTVLVVGLPLLLYGLTLVELLKQVRQLKASPKSRYVWLTVSAFQLIVYGGWAATALSSLDDAWRAPRAMQEAIQEVGLALLLSGLVITQLRHILGGLRGVWRQLRGGDKSAR